MRSSFLNRLFKMDKDKASKENLKTAGAVVGGAVLGAVALPVGKNTNFRLINTLIENIYFLFVQTDNCLVLPLLGFSSAGVVAGTVAASAQSYVYGAFTTGVFRFFLLK